MADFCEECNKPYATSKDSAGLAVYCQCHMFSGKTKNQIARPKYTKREEVNAENVIKSGMDDALGTQRDIEANNQIEDAAINEIDYELVLDDLMQRYAEMGIAVSQIKRILREQGKEVE